MGPGPALLFPGLVLGLLPAPRTPQRAPPAAPQHPPEPGTPMPPRDCPEGVRDGGQVPARAPTAPSPGEPSAPCALRAPLRADNATRRSAARWAIRARRNRAACVIQQLKITSDQGPSPLKVHRKLVVTLDANVRFDCPHAMVHVERWQVLPVQNTRGPHDWSKALKVNLELGTRAWILIIPSNFLAPGTYAFNYSLSLLRDDQLLLKVSDCFYITFVRNPLSAVIAGPPKLILPFMGRLVLNGSLSSDPDASDPQAGLHFFWFCTITQGHRQNDHCVPGRSPLWWASQGPVLTFQPGTLRGNSKYLFRLIVQKGSRNASDEKIVQVGAGPVPTTYITCLENCGPFPLVSNTLSLFLNCTQCSDRDIYKWSFKSSGLFKNIPFDWSKQTTTGRNTPYLSLKAFALRDFPESIYRLEVQLSTWGGQEVRRWHRFTINHPPQVGQCVVDPAQGIELLTEFVVRCSDFHDKNGPLTYKIVVLDLHGFGEISSLKENLLGAIVYLGHMSTTPATFLPRGDAADGDSLMLYAQVSDSRGAFSQLTFQATVHKTTNTFSSQALLQHLHNLTTAPNSSFMALVSKRNFLAAGYLLYLATCVLNHMQAELALQAELASLHLDLVNLSFLLPLGTIEDISQVIVLVTKLTKRVAEFTRLAQKRVALRIWQNSRALQLHSAIKGIQMEQVDMVCVGVLTALSNLLAYTSYYEVVEEPLYVLQGLVDTVMARKVPGNETTVLRSAGVNIYVRKTLRADVSGLCEESAGPCFQPTLTESSVQAVPGSSPVSAMFCVFAADPFAWLTYPELSSVQVGGFEVTGMSENGDEVNVIPDVADVFLLRRNLSAGLFPLTVGPTRKPGWSVETLRTTMGAFSFQVEGTTREVLVYILTEVTVVFTATVYAGHQVSAAAHVATFLVPPDLPPVANQSSLFDPACPVQSPRVLCLSPSLLQLVTEKSPASETHLVVVLQAPRFVTHPNDQLVSVAVLRLSCLDMDGDGLDEWREHACVLGPRTTWARVHCVCRSRLSRTRRQSNFIKMAGQQLKTHFLTSRVLVTPNFVDLRFEVIKTIPQNPVTLFTVLFIMLVYVVFAFWALHRDETDQYLRDHVVVLPDNDPNDTTCYLLTFFTGSRCCAGTSADVFVQLRGSEGISDVHCLSHPQIKSLYRGSINTFLLTTPTDLGDIQSLRVWHNNEGLAPSWYLSRVKVESLFSRRIWLFLCRQWLSVDTVLEVTLTPMLPDAPLERKDYFLIDYGQSLGTEHSWFSVFVGVVSNSFNRLQRLSCCVASLLCTLVCNIMFFNLNPEGPDNPMTLHYVQSMVIGMQSNLITFPAQLAITSLFTYSQKRPDAKLEDVETQKQAAPAEQGHWEERLEAWYTRETAKAPKKPARKKVNKLQDKASPPPPEAMPQQHVSQKQTPQKHPRPTPQKHTKSLKSLSKSQDSGLANRNVSNANIQRTSQDPKSAAAASKDLEPPKKKFRVVLPAWCVLIAWLLVFLVTSVSSFFIIFYGLTYGYEKSLEWLFASFCSFCQSMLLIQPVKLLLTTGYRTNQPKYCKNLSWTSNYQYIEINLPGRSLKPKEAEMLHQDLVRLRHSRMYQPLTADEIRIFQRRRRLQRRALRFLSYVLMHLVFLALLLALVAVLRHADSYEHRRFLRDRFSEGLGKVTKLPDVYQWLHRVALPLLHNDQHPTFLPDSSCKILGLPLLRQVRAVPGAKHCPAARKLVPNPNLGDLHCHPEYGVDPEDFRNYSRTWSNASALKDEAFRYRWPKRDWTYATVGLLNSYGPGGYAVHLHPREHRSNSTLRIAVLRAGNWLDERTWAVLLELSTLSPDAGLLCSMSVLFEASQLGVVNTSLSLHAFALADWNPATSAEVYLYAALLVFFVAYVADEAFVMWHERATYLLSAYNCLNLALKCLFAVGIKLFLEKHLLATRLIRACLAQPAEFVPFHAVAQVDYSLRVVLGFLVFLAILKSLRYARVFYTVRLVQRAIQVAMLGICHMALVGAVFLLVYVVFGCLVFGQHEWSYSSLVRATQTTLTYCVAAFGSTTFHSSRLMGLLFLAAFVLLMICILVNLFQVVILSTYKAMKQPVFEELSDEAEATAYVNRKLRELVAFVLCQRKAEGEANEFLEPEFFEDMVYGQPLKTDRRYLGLKTRTMKGKKMVYLVA